MDRKKLSNQFNKFGTKAMSEATDKWYLGGALVAGVLLYPFSMHFSLLSLALPTLGYGTGVAAKGISKILAPK